MTEYHGPVLNSPADTRVRFCPSPTGTPHVGEGQKRTRVSAGLLSTGPWYSVMMSP